MKGFRNDDENRCGIINEKQLGRLWRLLGYWKKGKEKKRKEEEEKKAGFVLSLSRLQQETRLRTI